MAEGGLKKLIGSLLSRTRNDETEAEPVAETSQASFEQTVIRLQQMVEERSFVEVRFPGRADNTYQSLILKVDPLERYVLIDELFPSHGAFFVSPGDEVEITSIRRGIPVRFSTWVKSISITEQDGIPAYRLALPDAVEASDGAIFVFRSTTMPEYACASAARTATSFFAPFKTCRLEARASAARETSAIICARLRYCAIAR